MSAGAGSFTTTAFLAIAGGEGRRRRPPRTWSIRAADRRPLLACAYGAVALEDAPLSLVLPLATIAAALSGSGQR